MAARFTELASKTCALVMHKGKPAFEKFMQYARVELRPPNLADVNVAVAECNRLMEAAKNGAWKQVKFRDGLLNAAVTVEVLCWFFVGEIIGRRSIIGYSRIPGCYIKAH